MKAVKEFYDTHPDSAGAKLFGGDVYRKFAGDLFYERNPKQIMEGGLFSLPDAKAFLEDYFKTDLTI